MYRSHVQGAAEGEQQQQQQQQDGTDAGEPAAAGTPSKVPVPSIDLAGVVRHGVTNSEVGMSRAAFEELAGAFAGVDAEDSGYAVGADSVRTALEKAGCGEVPPGELALLLESVDPERTGRVSFRGFVGIFRALKGDAAEGDEQGLGSASPGKLGTSRTGKATLSSRLGYLEHGQLTEDEAVLEFLRALEEHRRACEREGRYLEARTAALRINDLKVHEESRKREEIRARQMGERLEAERAYASEAVEHATMWVAKDAEYEMSVKEQVERLKAAHMEKLVTFKQGVESRAPTRPQYSKELLNQRNIQVNLAKQGKYLEAQKVKKAADAMEKVELGATVAAYKAEAELRLGRLQAQQAQEMQALLQRASRGRDELRKAREGDTARRDQRYKNVLAELDQVQKMETVHLNAFLSKQTLAGKRDYAAAVDSPRTVSV